MKHDNIEHDVAMLVEKLPPMPENIDRLLITWADKEPDKEQKIEKIIRSDPGLCADLLHLANDSCFSNNGSVDTIEEALETIGVEALMQMTAVSYAQQVVRGHFRKMRYLDDYFRHSRDISNACRAIAMANNSSQKVIRMYAASGLIHDVGRLVMLLASEQESAPLMGTSFEKMHEIVDDEHEVLGLDHCHVGMQLGKKWNFTPVMQQGILRHHTPVSDGDFSYPGSLIFVAHFLGASDLSGRIVSNYLPEPILRPLGLGSENWRKARQYYEHLQN